MAAQSGERRAATRRRPPRRLARARPRRAHGAVSPQRLRHRRRRRGDPSCPTARFARGTPRLRPVRRGLIPPNLPQTDAFSKVIVRMGYAPRSLLAGGLGLAASFLVACGGGGNGLLSSDQASSLQGQLDQLSAALNAGHCGAAANAADALKSTVDNLPSSINSGLATNLQQGASTVASLEQNQCSQS